MNLIPKVAEMLGVEIGEEFKLKSNVLEYDEIYCLMEDGLMFKDKYGFSESCRFKGLITGDFEIIKLPFEPKEGGMYYSIFWDEPDITACPCKWKGVSGDFCRKYSGNCFRTEAEAEAHKYEIYEKLTGKKWEE